MPKARSAEDRRRWAEYERHRYWQQKHGREPPPQSVMGYKPRNGWGPAPPPPPRKRPSPVLPPVPTVPVGHSLYEEARRHLRSWERAELGSDMDSIARDLMAEYALAALEGRDPAEAVVAARRVHQRNRAVLIHGFFGVEPR